LAVPIAVITLAPAFAADSPEREIITPSPGLRLIASLDHSRLQAGRSIQLRVELRNEGTGQVLVPRAGRCNPALQLTIWSASDAVAWAQGLPLCLEPHAAPPRRIAPGSSISAEQCFDLAVHAGTAAHCALLELPAATYQVGGSFYGMTLPRLNLTLAP
jgi:uncharacterized protein (DUF58 family)